MPILNFSAPPMSLSNAVGFHHLPLYTAFQIMLDRTTVVRRGILCVLSSSPSTESIYWMQGVSFHRGRGEEPHFVSLLERIPETYIHRLTMVNIPSELFSEWVKSVPASMRAFCEQTVPKREHPTKENDLVSSPFMCSQLEMKPKRAKTGPKPKGAKQNLLSIPDWQCTSPPSSIERERDEDAEPKKSGKVARTRSKSGAQHLETVECLRVAIDMIEDSFERRFDLLQKKFDEMDKEFTEHVTILVQKGFY